MLAPDFSIADVESIGPVIESLLNLEKLNAKERAAVDICARAAFDLANIRHTEIAQQFYSRIDIKDHQLAVMASFN